MAEVAFSADGKYFAAISYDGRLRIWDTESNVLKQEYTPDLHLSAPPSCLQWILIGNSENARKSGKRSSLIENKNLCVALGTTNGRILVYSVTEAKIHTVLEDKSSEIQNNDISSLDWHRNYGLYSSNKDGFVHEWDLSKGKVRNKYNVVVESKSKKLMNGCVIKIVPHNQKTSSRYIVAAISKVCLWQLTDGEKQLLKTFGHSCNTRPLLSLATVKKRSWLIEGSLQERLLSFWDVTIEDLPTQQRNGDDVVPTKKQRKKSLDPSLVVTPSYNFVLEDAPKTLDVFTKEVDGNVKIHMAAATRSGVVHYYGHLLNGASTKPIKPTVTLQVATEDARPLPLQCCQLARGETGSDGGVIVLGYEAEGRLTFERVSPDTSTKTQVLIRAAPAGAAAAGRAGGPRRHEERVTYVEPLGGHVGRKRTEPGAKLEVTMETRLANLALEPARARGAARLNLARLLLQGLHSGDRGIILTVLQNDDPQVALKTMSHFPADHLPQLLAQLGDMAVRKTSQCAAVCTWLGAALRTHSALLLATLGAPPACDHVARILAVFSQRRSHLCQLLNLKGRLELAAAQRAPDADAADAEPVLRYNDSSSDEEEAAGYDSEPPEEGSLGEEQFDDSASEADDT